jgi:DNA-binding MarR family transcriptional regulator
VPTATKPSPRPGARAGLADELLVVVTRLARRLRRLNDDGISPTMRSILNTLEKAGPLTHGELAQSERVRPPTITAAVDRLEQDDLVTRVKCDQDRRVARVQITDVGRELLAEGRRKRTAYLERRLRTLSAEDRAALAAAAPALERLLDDPDALR